MIKKIIDTALLLSHDYEMVDDLIDELLTYINGLDMTQHDAYALEEIVLTLQDEIEEDDVYTFVKKFCQQIKKLKVISNSFEEDDLANSKKAKKLMG